MKIRVLHGPNLNLLGTREPGIYGGQTLAQINQSLQTLGLELGWQVDCSQSNHEGQLIDWIQALPAEGYRGLILNGAAYTHTSIAIADALRAVAIPTVEVHLSNIYARESFRQHSLTAPVAWGVITGLGPEGYLAALRALAAKLA